MSEGRKKYPDPLVRQRLFPDAVEIFAFAPASLAQALENGIVVVDTNVLLVPYTTGPASLEQIRRTYETLVTEKRLRIPGQVAREFADNRAEKLKTLYQQLSRKREINLTRYEYPLLEGLAEYAEVLQRETAIVSALAEYRKAIGKLLTTVEAWNWDDPVSLIYRQLFVPEVIVEPPFDRDELLEELRFRQEHEIPPGYKDSSNKYSGIGDLLIWKALLDIGKQTSRDVVFVSGDEKSDWRYQSENTALYPRFELLQEYRAASGGRSLLIISFARLLEQFGVPAPVVEEVRKEEAVAALSMPSETSLKSHMAAIRAERAVFRWLLTRFPDGQIHHAPQDVKLDFVVASKGGVPEGYEIKYLRRPSLFHRHIRDWAYRIQAQLQDRPMPINLVIVVDDDELLAEAMRRAPFGLKPGMGIAKLFLGILTEDATFQEQYWLRFDEGPITQE
jgi:rRNA-processing protein FCF1